MQVSKITKQFFILVKIGREGRVRKDGAISSVRHLNPFSYWPPLQKYNFLPILSLLCKSKMPVICFGKKYYASDCQKYAYTTSSPPLQEAGGRSPCWHVHHHFPLVSRVSLDMGLMWDGSVAPRKEGWPHWKKRVDWVKVETS